MTLLQLAGWLLDRPAVLLPLLILGPSAALCCAAMIWPDD